VNERYFNKNYCAEMAMDDEQSKVHVEKMANKPLEYARQLGQVLNPKASEEMWRFVGSKYKKIYGSTGWLDNPAITAMINEIDSHVNTKDVKVLYDAA
jgi:hypothetical protein